MINKELLLEAADVIEKNEMRFDQNSWGIIRIDNHNGEVHTDLYSQWADYNSDFFVAPSCGTPGCCAAWIYTLANKKLKEKNKGTFMAKYEDVFSEAEPFMARNSAEAAGFDYWTQKLIFAARWPSFWMTMDDDIPILIPNTKYFYGGMETPDHEEAARVLRQIALNGIVHEKDLTKEEVEAYYNG